MRSTTRLLALGLAVTALAACSHKDKNAPLAFVPADTPYVVAKIKPLDDDTRKALLAQADARLPLQLAQFSALADEMAATDADTARLLHALVDEQKGRTIEDFATRAGIELNGRAALYGVGLAPVLRIDLADPAAFEAFIARLETAYGKPLEVAQEATQSYRRLRLPSGGTQVILAVAGKQAVAALLPADAPQALLRQALGLDRPTKNLQDDGHLKTLAKAKGYQDWLVGELDLTRVLPLLAGGKDPLFSAILEARARAESAKTGEPVANQLQTPPSCATDAARIAARVPGVSFGYTRLDAKHQDARFDVALAQDISQAFAGLKVDLPGLGAAGSTPFDISIALPVMSLREFWSAQADAVAAKPFACPRLTDLNDQFAKLGSAMQSAAIPPFGDMLGLRVALDTLAPAKSSSVPAFSGRIVLATSNPAGLLATGQMMVPSLARLKLAADGKPVALPPDMASMIGQPAWLAMGPHALALGMGAGEDAKLAEALAAPAGDAGRMLRMHINGAMYLDWLQLMEDKADALAAASAAISKSDDPALGVDGGDSVTDASANAARSKAQFALMKAQAEQVDTIDVEMHVDDDGMVISSQTALK